MAFLITIIVMLGVKKTHMQFMSHDIATFLIVRLGRSTGRWSNWTTHSSKQANRKAVPPVPAEYSSTP
jgi:16S rRNA U1498 N3-methylase RsmE